MDALGFWWACVNADAELTGEPIKKDAVILHFMGSGASARVTAADLDDVCRTGAAALPPPTELDE